MKQTQNNAESLQQPSGKPWFVLPLPVKLKYWFLPITKRLWPIEYAVLILVLLFGMMWASIKLTSASPAFKHPEVAAVFAALSAAVVAAVITAVASSTIQQRQLTAQYGVARKGDTFAPLYDQLKEYKRKLEQHPYFIRISFETGPQGPYTPAFPLWAEIQSDSRLLSVPEWLAKALDDYLDEMAFYEVIRSQAVTDTHDRVAGMLEESFLMEWRRIHGADHLLLKALLIDDFGEFCYHINTTDQWNTITKEQLSPVWNRSRTECLELQSVKRYKQFYETSIIGHADWLIQEIEKIIRYINSTSGHHGPLL